MSESDIGSLLSNQPLLALTIGAIILAVAGQMVMERRPGLGTGMRKAAYLGMLAAGLLTVAHLALEGRTSDAAYWLDHTREATVAGSESVITMRADGHFWVKAELNGEPVDFMIDTGATYTAVTARVAERTGLVLSEESEGHLLDTANGTVVAKMGRARSLRFGNIAVTDLPLAILPNATGDTAVIGMNLLSQLKTWRVEDNRLILTPKSPS